MARNVDLGAFAGRESFWTSDEQNQFFTGPLWTSEATETGFWHHGLY